MSSAITATTFDQTSGTYQVTSTASDGSTKTVSVGFDALCMLFTLNSLEVQDEVFAIQFEEAKKQVDVMTAINDCLQMFNKYSATASDAGKNDIIELDGTVAYKTYKDNGKEKIEPDHYSDDELANYEQLVYYTEDGTKMKLYYEKGSDADAWLNYYKPLLVDSGIIQDSGSGSDNSGVGLDCNFSSSELSAIMENLQSAQSTVSSQNEEQMMLTNDAANKRSTILQMAQSLLQEANKSKSSAAS